MEKVMRCIFCKKDAKGSKSVEHIIPESLGNKDHILPPGIVCDDCNNYFALKIEKPVLELSYFKSLRGRNSILNKRRKIPGVPGFIRGNLKEEIEVFFSKGNTLEVNIPDKTLFDEMAQHKHHKLYIPILTEPPKENTYVSKLLGKMALEALASRTMGIEGWRDEFVDNEAIDQLREFVRFGAGYKSWEYHQRIIYPEGKVFSEDNSTKVFEVLHEFDFLFPDKPEPKDDQMLVIKNLYFVCAIMGVEYTINVTNAGIARYLQWLKDNKNQSILLLDKGQFNDY